MCLALVQECSLECGGLEFLTDFKRAMYANVTPKKFETLGEHMVVKH